MATIVNDKDEILQAATIRLEKLPANYIRFSNSAPVFTVATDATISPANYAITAELVGQLSGTVTWSVVSGTVATTGINGNTWTISGSDLTTNIAVIRASLGYLGVTYTSDLTVTKLTQGEVGAPAIYVDLYSESDVVAAETDGTGYTLPTGNSLKLYSGGTELTTGVTYGPLSTVKNGLTLTVNATTGAITLTGASNSWNTDQESFTLTATYNSIIYTAIYSLAKSKKGSDLVAIDLVNENDIVATETDGTGYALPTGNSIRLFRGGVQLTSGVTYGPASTVKNGLTLAVNSSTGALTLTGASNSWTSNQESFVITATINSIVYSSTYNIVKNKKGVTGTSATYFRIKSTADVIFKDAPDVTTDGTHTSVTFFGEKVEGTTVTTVSTLFYTITANGVGEAATATVLPLGGYTLSLANTVDKSSYTFKLYDTAAKTTLLDQETIPVVFKGATGTPATYFRIKATADVIFKDAPDVTTDGAHTSVTFFGEKVEGTTVTTVSTLFYTITANGVTEAATATALPLGGYTLSPTNSVDKTSYTFKLYNAAAKTTLLDQETIPIVFKGATGNPGTPAITGQLTRDSVVLPADQFGNVLSFADANGTFKVLDGTTDKTGNTTEVVYSVNSSTGVTVSIANTGIYNVTAVSPPVGKKVVLTTVAQVFNYTTGISPTNTVVTATASNFPVGTTLFYEFVRVNSTVQNTTSNTYTYTPNATYSSMPETVTVRVREGTNNSTVIATDSIAMQAVRTTSGNARGFLTNADADLAADIEGIVSAAELNTATGTFRVFTNTGTEVTGTAVQYTKLSSTNGADGTIDTAGTYKLTVLPTTSTTGTITFRALHNNITHDQTFTVVVKKSTEGMTATLRAVYNSVNLDKQLTVTRNRQGVGGQQAADAYLYVWSAGVPNSPNATSTYTWSTNSNATYTGTNGWQTTIPAAPATPGIKLYIAKKSVTASSGTTTTLVDWTSGVSIYAYTGSAGDAGVKTIEVVLYSWSTTIPTITGTHTYTWSTNTLTSTPTGWTQTVQNTATAANTLWKATVQVVAPISASTTSIDWTTASILPHGYVAATGAVSRIAYAQAASLSASPVIYEITGDVVPATGTWSAGVVWSTSVPVTVTAGNQVWRSDGVYNPGSNKTFWSAPYLAQLKVGNLSAISTNTGNLTVSGDVVVASNSNIRGGQTAYNTGTGFFLGYDSTAYKFSIGTSTNGLTWSGSSLSILGANNNLVIGTSATTGARITINYAADNAIKGYDSSGVLRTEILPNKGHLYVQNDMASYLVGVLSTTSGGTAVSGVASGAASGGAGGVGLKGTSTGTGSLAKGIEAVASGTNSTAIEATAFSAGTSAIKAFVDGTGTLTNISTSGQSSVIAVNRAGGLGIQAASAATGTGFSNNVGVEARSSHYFAAAFYSGMAGVNAATVYLNPVGSLPSIGAIQGALVVVGGKLYFHNGTAWKEVAFV